MARVNCLGVLVVDALSGPLARYPEPRVHPQVVTESVRFSPGGGAANTSAALARMGIPVGVFAKVGDDPNGAFLRQNLAALGVDTTGMVLSPSDTTPFTFVGIHPNGERTFIHTPGANKTFTIADLQIDRVLDAEFLLYPDCWVLPGLDGMPGAALLAEARQRGVTTLLDECWGLGPNRALFEAMVPHCDFVLPSLDDLQAIYPDWPADAIAQHLLALGCGAVVLKMGAAGCLLFHRGRQTSIPALPAQVVDTTGAGDCWNAGFLAGLTHGADPVEAARIGSACAAYGIEAVGGATGVPDYPAVLRRATQAGD